MMRSNYGIAAMAVFLIAVSGILWYFLTVDPENGQRTGAHNEDLASKWRPAKKVRPPDVPMTGELLYLSTVTGTVERMIDGKPVKEFEIGSVPVPGAEDGAWSPEEELDFKQVLSRISWVKQQHEDGHFYLAKVASDVPVLVIARSKGYSPEYIEIPGIGQEEVHEDVVISLPPGAYLRGEVSNRAGAPIEGASVLVGPNTQGEQPAAWSDSHGRFFITVLMEDDRVLLVSHPDYYPRTIPFSFVPEENIEVRVVLEQGGVLEGCIRENGIPLPGYQVVLLMHTSSEATDAIVPSEVKGITGPDGFYTMRKIPRGPATVRVMPRSDGSTWPSTWVMQDVIVEEGMVTVLDFDFPLTTSVVEGVVLEDGQPPKEALISLTLSNDLGETTWSGTTDIDGYYRIENLAAGSGVIEAKVVVSDGLTRKRKTEVEIGEGVVVRQDIEFPTAAAVYGTVLGIRYNERAGMAVFRGDLSGTVFTVLSDFQTFEEDRVSLSELPPDGLFQLDTLEPGTYTLIAGAASVRVGEPMDPEIPFRMVLQVVNMQAGEAQFLELKIP